MKWDTFQSDISDKFLLTDINMSVLYMESIRQGKDFNIHYLYKKSSDLWDRRPTPTSQKDAEEEVKQDSAFSPMSGSGLQCS